MLAALRQQFLGRGEGIAEWRGIVDDDIAATGGFVHDKPPAHRVVHPRLQRLAGCVEGGKTHAVGVKLEAFLAVHDQVIAVGKRDITLSGQME